MSGRVHHGCPNASNPYHECNDRCFERIYVPKKEKKPFSFGKPAWRKETCPISPARVTARNRSPLPIYYSKRMVESDDSPSFSSSDDTFNANLFRPRFPIHDKKADQLVINWLPMSPSLAEYCKKDSFPSKFDHREGEASIHYGVDTEMPPRTRPKTPEHPLKTPQHRPHAPDSRPRARDTRPRTAERRPMSPEYRETSSMHWSKTPEPQGKYLEPSIPLTQPISHRSHDTAAFNSPRKLESRPEVEEYRSRPPDHRARNPRPGSRIPQTQPTSFIIGGKNHSAAQRSPQATEYYGNKTSSVYTDECILLYPELLLSSSRPITVLVSLSLLLHLSFSLSQIVFHTIPYAYNNLGPFSLAVEDMNHRMNQRASTSVTFYSWMALFIATLTPPRPIHRSRKSSPKQSNELSDEFQSFTLSETERIFCVSGKETQSIMSESYVSVGSYKVRASVSNTLQQILDKHGDIASDSKLESLPTRSYSLESLAVVVLELQSTPLKQLKDTRVLEMIAVVKDVESVKIRAGWLREVLNEILEAARCYDRHKTTMVEKDMCERSSLLGRQEMEKVMKEVRLKEKEVRNFRQGLTEMAGRLGDLEMKRARLGKNLAFLSFKVDKFDGDSVLENVF